LTYSKNPVERYSGYNMRFRWLQEHSNNSSFE
jgi:hypothetical protein